MIIARLTGGLGNQMFQYAAGRRLALRSRASLKLDLSWYRRYSGRRFELGAFRVEAEPARPAEVSSLKGWRGGRKERLLSALTGGALLGPDSYLREQGLGFEARILEPRPAAYLDGYWQSERYFADASDVIRADFRLAAPPSAAMGDQERRIASTLAVSVHVRRGDYVGDSKTARVHGACPASYYRRCADFLVSRLAAAPTFFVFGDDPEWARQSLPLPGPTVHVSTGALSAPEELVLMSRCRHHVVANSTFSWWGAWLDPTPDKIVLAPERWFRDPARKSADLVPPSWTLL